MSFSQLRPRSISELLDHAFRLYRANFLTFLGIAGVLSVPFAIILSGVQYMLFSSALGSSAPTTTDFVSFAIYYAVIASMSLAQVLLIQPLVTGGLARAVDRFYRINEPFGILEAYQIGWKSFFSLLAVALLASMIGLFIGVLIAAVILVPVVLPLSRGEEPGAGVAFALIGFIGLAILYAIALAIVSVRLLFNTQAIVLEGAGPIEGLRRSWSLSRGSFWRTLLIMIIMGVLSYLIAIFPSMIVFGFGQLVFRDIQQLAILQAAGTLLQYLSQVLVLPLQLITYTLLYFDLRIRREGMDMEYAAPVPVVQV